jgi:hypothetical protein
MSRILLLSLLVSISAPALAIYKCESNGKVTYSDEACRGGKVIELPEPTGKTLLSSDAASARRQVAHEKSEVKRLENERHKREAAEDKQQQRVARLHAVKQKKCASLAMRQKWSEEDAAAAIGKSAGKAKRRARRKAEQYENECGK